MVDGSPSGLYVTMGNFETGTTNAEKLILAWQQVRPGADEVV